MCIEEFGGVMIDLKNNVHFWGNGITLNEKIKCRLIDFIENQNKILYRGMKAPSDMENSKFIHLLSNVGEKSNWFKGDNLDTLIYEQCDFDDREVYDHVRGRQENSAYVSSSEDFLIALDFSKNDEEGIPYVIMLFTNDSDKTRSTGYLDYEEESEVLLLHAIFPNRIIGIIREADSQSDKMYDLFINKNLLRSLQLDEKLGCVGTRTEFEVDQSRFEEENKELGNKTYGIKRSI